MDSDLETRLFGQDVQPAMQARPGVERRGNFRDIMQGGDIVPRSVKDPLLSDEDRARAALLLQQMSALLQNTNITASQPAHNAPNLWSTPVDLSVQVTVPGAVGGYQTAITFVAPPGRWVRITGYGYDVSSPAAFPYDGSLLWQITKNGLPVQTISDFGEHRGTIIRPRDTFILLNGNTNDSNGGGDVIKFNVMRAIAAANPATVQMALIGYTWRPRNDHEGTRASIGAF
jgi:hypothetical protein